MDKKSLEKLLKEFGIDGEAAELIHRVLEGIAQEESVEDIYNKDCGPLVFLARTPALVHWAWLAQLTPGRTVEMFSDACEWEQAVFLGMDYDNDSWPVLVGLWDERGKTLCKEWVKPDRIRPINAMEGKA